MIGCLLCSADIYEGVLDKKKTTDLREEGPILR